MHQPAKGQASAANVVRVVSGNFLEMYDFMVYGFYASSIARAMFPGDNEFVSLMLSLATFGMGFLMRPLGAVVLGSYMDRRGRRAGLILTLSLMSVGVLLIAVTPTYASIGALAPVLVIFGRLLQGFSAGAESGGVSVYLSEVAPPGRRGFYVSWQSASQQISVLLAAVLGVALRFTLSNEQMDAWGWRIPFLLGCSIVPVLFWIRRSVTESHVFKAQKQQSVREIFASLGHNWRIISWSTMLVSLTSIMFYLITAYTPTFGRAELGLKPIDTFYVTTCVALTTFVMIPLMAALSDRIGRRPLLIGASLTIAIVAYPAMTWLVAAPSFMSLLLVEVGFALLYAAYQAALVVTLTEIIPANVRGTGFSLAYSLSQAIFGGFTPAICTALIHVTSNKAMPGVWLVIGALFALLATLVIVRGDKQPVGEVPAQSAVS
jgi:MFS family permease